MKLLDSYSDSDEADRVCGLLEEKGIPVFRERAGSVRGRMEDAVFVCLDQQFEDARTILQFPSHTPAEPVDAEQFHRDVEADGMKSTFDYLFVPGLVIIAGIVILFAAIYFLGKII